MRAVFRFPCWLRSMQSSYPRFLRPFPRTRAKGDTEPKCFTVVFYGSIIFGCKTAQFCATPRECLTTEVPSVSHAVQRSENARKNSVLNYKSAALSRLNSDAEFAATREGPKRLFTFRWLDSARFYSRCSRSALFNHNILAVS
jgi:hypothetical protein